MSVENANFHAGPDEKTALVQRIKDDIGSFLSTVFTEVLNPQYDVVAAVRRRIQKELVDRWKKPDTNF